MCRCLDLPRSTFYYEAQEKKPETSLQETIVEIFHANRDAYGSRKIKDALSKVGLQVSRRRIRRIMQEQGIVSKYTVAQFKVHKQTCNEDKIGNKLNRQFDNQEPYAVVISDLTYVRVKNKWNYICLLVDLFNREIIGYSAGRHKDAELVSGAFSKVNTDLRNIKLFHTDRGSEFKNKLIDNILDSFQLDRSLSKKGCPYDNAVAEATFKLCKTEFINGRTFENLTQLQLELADYVNWFNNFRTHSSLNYQTPAEARANRPYKNCPEKS